MRVVVFILLAVGLTWAVVKSFPQPGASVPAGGPNSADKAYHGQVFDYVMEHIEAGKNYAWQTSSVVGSIAAEAKYKSKSGSICRSYREEIKTAASQGQVEGIACRRKGRDGWCRLEKDNVQTCALEERGINFHVGGINFGDPYWDGLNIGDVNVDLDFSGPDASGISVRMPDAPKAKDQNFLRGRNDDETTAEWLVSP